MVADPTARTVGKISGGSKKYRKGVDHRKEGRALKRGGGVQRGAKLCTTGVH